MHEKDSKPTAVVEQAMLLLSSQAGSALLQAGEAVPPAPAQAEQVEAEQVEAEVPSNDAEEQVEAGQDEAEVEEATE